MKEGEFVFGSIGAGTEFLRAELLAGLTRARIAQNATTENKKVRNRLEARKAYDTILRFLPQTSLSQKDAQEIHFKVTELRFELQSLGEDV